MDPAPTAFADLPLDPELGAPVPFACGTDDRYGAARDGAPVSARTLDGRRVTQCALSRICGVCGAGLGRPIAFLGSPEEAARNAFHFPPAHLACAQALLAAYERVPGALLGQVEPPPSWVLVTTAAFEFVRPGREEVDRRPTFAPHAILEQVR
ncbi:hypothetical protein [Nocardioides ferulae]|uniref:hypothetical protein n=1 Tax=Nocardioides ferulae TaxID=2340821 RepID=UPI0013DDE00D|nr:hypothetical protein [Nocardioides ferulae]